MPAAQAAQLGGPEARQINGLPQTIPEHAEPCAAPSRQPTPPVSPDPLLAGPTSRAPPHHGGMSAEHAADGAPLLPGACGESGGGSGGAGGGTALPGQPSPAKEGGRVRRFFQMATAGPTFLQAQLAQLPQPAAAPRSAEAPPGAGRPALAHAFTESPAVLKRFAQQ